MAPPPPPVIGPAYHSPRAVRCQRIPIDQSPRSIRHSHEYRVALCRRRTCRPHKATSLSVSQRSEIGRRLPLTDESAPGRRSRNDLSNVPGAADGPPPSASGPDSPRWCSENPARIADSGAPTGRPDGDWRRRRSRWSRTDRNPSARPTQSRSIGPDPPAPA